MLIGLLLSVFNRVEATHIIGGEIFYDCLGNGQFRVTLKLYRDCFLGQAPYDNPATVSVYNSSGVLVQNLFMQFPGSNVLPINALTPCYQDNAQVCVEEAVYEEIISLPASPGGYTLSYQRCCRNESILNIFDPGETGSTYTIQIPESAWTDCNSSPRFNNFPPIVLCVNDPLIFDHSATDPDGDQLVYSFCSPFEGGSTTDPMPVPAAPPPYNFVNFIPPYSATNPLASTPGATVDPVTGEINGMPTAQGQYVVAVCVEEYRNGVLLSVNKRDFQFNVINCSGISIADFEAPQADIATGNVCNGLVVGFVNQSEFSTFFQWDFGVDGITTDISELANPVFVYPDTGVYTVMLISNPGFNCSDTAFLNIAVYRELTADIALPDPQCITGNSFDFVAGGEFESNANFAWTFGGSVNQSTSTDQNPANISWNEAGVFPVTLLISNPYCTAFDSTIVVVHPELEVGFTVNANNVCEPATIIFTNTSAFSPGASFLWEFGDGNTSTLLNPIHQYLTPGSYDVSLTVNNIVGCTDTSTLSRPAYITVRESPDAGIDASPLVQSILTPEVTFEDLSENDLDTWLEPGDGSRYEFPDVMHIYTDTGTFDARVIAVNEVGCYDTASIKIKIEPIFTFYVPNAFTPNGDSVNDTFYPRIEGFKRYEMVIFDRWGDEVFRTTDIGKQWDGKSNGGKNISPLGVYTYTIKVLDILRNERSYLGSVTLVR